VDGYDNDNGGGFNPPLKESDSVTFLNKLAAYAHDTSHNMGIGLKNSGAIVEATKATLDWVVNEQCVQFTECDTFSPFINVGPQGKPVFHIEYQVDPNSSTPPASLHDNCY
jgi:endo-alpha-1,4-polygalactosaminidase (GH114 family)